MRRSRRLGIIYGAGLREKTRRVHDSDGVRCTILSGPAMVEGCVIWDSGDCKVNLGVYWSTYFEL